MQQCNGLNVWVSTVECCILSVYVVIGVMTPSRPAPGGRGEGRLVMDQYSS